MDDNRPNFSAYTNLWGPMAAPIEQWVTALKTWSEMWSAFLPAGWPSIPQQIWNPGGIGQTGASTARSVAVRVSSQRATEVMATLTPGSEYLPLTAEVPNLAGISISRDGTMVCVDLQVTPTQPAGTYQGSIMAVGREVGTISVTIMEPAQASATAPRTRRRRTVAK